MQSYWSCADYHIIDPRHEVVTMTDRKNAYYATTIIRPLIVAESEREALTAEPAQPPPPPSKTFWYIGSEIIQQFSDFAAHHAVDKTNDPVYRRFVDEIISQ